MFVARTCLLCKTTIDIEDEHSPKGVPFHQECAERMMELDREEYMAEKAYQEYIREEYLDA